MSYYITRLDETGNALMVYSNGVLIFSSSSKGVKPHLEAIQTLGKNKLHGTLMADKIVGRAAGLLMLYSRPSEVHAGVITLNAKRMLENEGITVYPKEVVDAVKQVDGRIYCPFESMVQGINDPDVAYHSIVEKLNSIPN
ncbi:DUF1893 domain-containing protein [Candidatus Bathyarchaeota archaeon]|nr:DUF1893 domain-containing protein [Candidatus Bathyarchaeota archaeon]